MKIRSIMLFVPATFISAIAKMNTIALNRKIKDKILDEGMYHFVPNEKVAQAIIQSEYLRPSQKQLKMFGHARTYMFGGKPTVEQYTKNVTNTNAKLNPYVNPKMIATAIKIRPTTEEELKNYKYRGLQDEAIVYEGYCILPSKAVEMVKMVPDLERDENGNPIKDNKGNYSLIVREAKEDEIDLESEEYKAKEDYLAVIEEKRKQLGYSKDNSNLISKINNTMTNIVDQIRMEHDVMKQSIKKNWKDVFKGIIERITTPKLEPSVEDTIKKFTFSKKYNPYQDSKFAKFVIQKQTQEGLEQLSLEETLSNLTESVDGQYLAQKYKELEGTINKKGIHGKDHANRVTITAMTIAQREGILENDQDNKIKDILITSAYLHDIGRIGNNGPHAARGARKIKNMDLRFLDGTIYSREEKDLVRALVEGHEGKPDKINKLLDKYHIDNPKYRELAVRLNSVVRDADALDRVRIDVKHFGYHINLKPEYLVNKTSTQLLNASYELENLTKKVTNINTILTYKAPENTVVFKKSTQREFYQGLKCEGLEPIDFSKFETGKQIKERDNLSK